MVIVNEIPTLGQHALSEPALSALMSPASGIFKYFIMMPVVIRTLWSVCFVNQGRIQGGFEGFVRTPPGSGGLLCTTTPPVDKHQN